VEALERDYTTASITPQERVMIDYVVKLTKDATQVWKDDHERLRAAGFDDRAIRQSQQSFPALPVETRLAASPTAEEV